MNLLKFDSIILLDFEYKSSPGENPEPLCLVAKDIISGDTTRLWKDELNALKSPPFDTGGETLLVSYYAAAELGCFIALGWPMPKNILDLFVEFKNYTNGNKSYSGYSLIGALNYFSIDSIAVDYKDEMRDLILYGQDYTPNERSKILDYCESDVTALEPLLEKMASKLNLSQAILRGDYVKAVAKIESLGIPIDGEKYTSLKENWEEIKSSLIEEMDAMCGVYDNGSFKQSKFEEYLIKHDISWPRTAKGNLDLKEQTFRDLSVTHPSLYDLYQLRVSLSKLRLSSLSVGTDSKNRVMLSPFSSKTSRNQPSNSKFIFGPSVWMRGLIKPLQGRAIGYIDWSQQEFGIAAALSQDEQMMEAYNSGDPYLTFGKQAGAVPENATKESHASERKLFKECTLAVQYGMGAESLSKRIKKTPVEAKWLLKLHRNTYKKFWEWSDACLDFATFYGYLETVFGWKIKTTDSSREPSIRNFPMQANGAEMLRLAAVLATNKEIGVCGLVHDAILIESSADQIEEDCRITIECMKEASRTLLSGFELKCDTEIVKFPERYMDDRGIRMWKKISKILSGIEEQDKCTPAHHVYQKHTSDVALSNPRTIY